MQLGQVESGSEIARRTFAPERNGDVRWMEKDRAVLRVATRKIRRWDNHHWLNPLGMLHT